MLFSLVVVSPPIAFPAYQGAARTLRSPVPTGEWCADWGAVSGVHHLSSDDEDRSAHV